MVDLILTDVPLKVKKSVCSGIRTHARKGTKRTKEIQSKVSLLDCIEIAFICDFCVCNKLEGVLALKKAINNEE